jgi:hypothetical protein
MSKEDTERIANRVVEILRSPDKKERIEDLRQRVLSEPRNEAEGDEFEDVVYAVLQALEELYG